MNIRDIISEIGDPDRLLLPTRGTHDEALQRQACYWILNFQHGMTQYEIAKHFSRTHQAISMGIIKVDECLHGEHKHSKVMQEILSLVDVKPQV